MIPNMLFHPQQCILHNATCVGEHISSSVVGRKQRNRALGPCYRGTVTCHVMDSGSSSHGFGFDSESTISNYLYPHSLPTITHHLSNLRRSRNVAPPLLNPNLFQKFVLCLRKFFQWRRVMRLPRVRCLDILELQQKSSKLSTRQGLCKWPYANVNVCRPGAAGRQVSGEAGYGRIAP